MNRRSFAAAAVSLALALALPLGAAAQGTTKIGVPMILSGPGALFGEPSVQGMQMLVDEVNAKGGVAGKKLQLVVRDTKGNADEAVRVTRELILKENVDFLVGTLTSAEGPAVSPIAKETSSPRRPICIRTCSAPQPPRPRRAGAPRK
jgi:branched-chain amino acid transport system substrate-binding protein